MGLEEQKMKREQFAKLKELDKIVLKVPAALTGYGIVELVTDRVWITWHYPDGTKSRVCQSFEASEVYRYADWEMG